MKEKSLEILCCPACGGELKLESSLKDGEDIVSGRLVCKACRKTYSIKDGIADLVP